jgi:hypothetical protein
MQSQRCPGACAIFSEILRKNRCIFWSKKEKSLSNFIYFFYFENYFLLLFILHSMFKEDQAKIKEKIFPDFLK